MLYVTFVNFLVSSLMLMLMAVSLDGNPISKTPAAVPVSTVPIESDIPYSVVMSA